MTECLYGWFLTAKQIIIRLFALKHPRIWLMIWLIEIRVKAIIESCHLTQIINSYIFAPFSFPFSSFSTFLQFALIFHFLFIFSPLCLHPIIFNIILNSKILSCSFIDYQLNQIKSTQLNNFLLQFLIRGWYPKSKHWKLALMFSKKQVHPFPQIGGFKNNTQHFLTLTLFPTFHLNKL